jgi:hypothetical protein
MQLQAFDARAAAPAYLLQQQPPLALLVSLVSTATRQPRSFVSIALQVEPLIQEVQRVQRAQPDSTATAAPTFCVKFVGRGIPAWQAAPNAL